MAEIRPLRGILYNPKRVSLSKVVTPPYDVITLAAQEEYYHRDPFNIIRLEYGKQLPKDSLETENRYTRARRYFRYWLKEGILTQDEEPSFYVYTQEYTLPGGERRTRRGFFAALRLVEFAEGVVLPHEETLSKPKADRLELMRACRANFSPVFGLYHDRTGRVGEILRTVSAGTAPRAEVTSDEGVRERLWSLTDPRVQAEIQGLLQAEKVYIADGHHRYETALIYRDERRAREVEVPTGDKPYDYILMMLVSLEDEGLTILPTHRLLKQLPGVNLLGFLNLAGENFEVTAYPFGPLEAIDGVTIRAINSEADQRAAVKRALAEAAAQGEHAFGLSWRRTPAYFFLKLRPGIDPAEVVEGPQTPAWKRLDVSILHRLLLEEAGLGEEEIQNGNYIAYTRSEEEALNGVAEGEYLAAVLMNPPRVAEVEAVAGAGEKMPQKSTYFYPKILTGLVINPLF